MTLPYLTAELPGTGGVLRAAPEDFVVDEVPAYPPSGAGEHVFVRIQKRGLTTPDAVGRLARALGLRPRDVGVAGMKDRHAVTTQWVSLPPKTDPDRAAAYADDELRVLEAHRHPHKLRTGHLRGNRFRLRVRGVADGATAVARAEAVLAELARAPGAPNWYGEQRFGRAGDNAAAGRALVTGAAPLARGDAGRHQRLLVSALQSELFNTWLTRRIAAGAYRTAIAGDVMHKRGGGLFDCTDVAVDGPRVTAGEIVPTGPMFGHQGRRPQPGSAAAAAEDAILAEAGLTTGDFARVGSLAEGTRRDAAIVLDDVAAARVDDDPAALEVRFTLPAGAYATVVMREVMKEPA
ncbi:MAG: tRNA pseudouridine(13) synthase TruD [Kofleriaceae bacterium]